MRPTAASGIALAGASPSVTAGSSVVGVLSSSASGFFPFLACPLRVDELLAEPLPAEPLPAEPFFGAPFFAAPFAASFFAGTPSGALAAFASLASFWAAAAFVGPEVLRVLAGFFGAGSVVASAWFADSA